MASIELKNLSKVFAGRGRSESAGAAAVRDVSIDIASGEFVVLVGPSGCGKTTTLRMIAGLEDPSGGTVSIDGRVVNNLPPKDRDIAMVFQNYALYPHMTVYRNMAFALKMRRVPREQIEQRVRAAAASLGIEGLLDRRPGELSGGQRQRVAVGRAIVREPKAFLFDEPLSNLDARLRVGTRAELKALHQRLKTTTVYVTHDQEEAMTLGDRIVVMAGGTVQQAGPPLEVYQRPANRFVATFIGSPSMNLFEGTLRADGASAVFTERGAGGVSITLPAGAERVAPQGGPITLGVRPQALRVASPGGAKTIPVTVEVVEPLGDQTDLACVTAAGTRLTARVDGTSLQGRMPRPGEPLALAPDPARVQLFETGEFGKRVWPA